MSGETTPRSRSSREREIVVLAVGGFLGGGLLWLWLGLGSYLLAVAEFFADYTPAPLVVQVLLGRWGPSDDIESILVILSVLVEMFLAGELVAGGYLIAHSHMPLRFVLACLPLSMAAVLTVGVPEDYRALTPKYAVVTLLLTGSGIVLCASIVSLWIGRGG